MSKRLEEIALEHGLCNCDEGYKNRNLINPDCPFHAFAVSEAMEQYAREVAQASLERASENIEIFDDAGYFFQYVKPESITNPDNIVL